MANILIAGCGKLGTQLGQELSNMGHDVTGIKRRARRPLSGLHLIEADLSIPEDLQRLPGAIDLVLVILSPDEGNETAYRNTYVTCLANLLVHYPSTGFIFVSSTSVYAQDNGEWVDENSATTPTSFRGKVLLEAEQLLQQVGSQEHLTVRFSGLYNRTSQFMQKQLIRGAAIQKEPPAYTNRIHREDCIGVLIHLTEMKLAGKATGPVYIASDDKPASRWEVLTFLSEEFDLPAPINAGSNTTGKQNKRCNNSLLKDSGYQFKYPSYREGYTASCHVTGKN